MKDWKELAGLAGVIATIAGGLVAIAYLLKSVTNAVVELNSAKAMNRLGCSFEKILDLTTKYLDEEIKDREEERARRIIRHAAED